MNVRYHIPERVLIEKCSEDQNKIRKVAQEQDDKEYLKRTKIS